MSDPSYLIQILISGLGVGCIYGLIGIGFCVIYNASGIVNFAQGAFVMMGGIVTHVLLQQYGVPMILSALLAVAFGALLGVVIERIVVRPLWDRNATMFVMILATLAAYEMANQAVDDEAVLALATREGRALLSHHRRHLIRPC